MSFGPTAFSVMTVWVNPGLTQLERIPRAGQLERHGPAQPEQSSLGRVAGGVGAVAASAGMHCPVFCQAIEPATLPGTAVWVGA